MIVDRESLDYIKNLGRAIGRFEVRYQTVAKERDVASEAAARAGEMQFEELTSLLAEAYDSGVRFPGDLEARIGAVLYPEPF